VTARRAAAAAIVAMSAHGALLAQVSWSFCGGGAPARVSGAASAELSGPRAAVELAAGSASVHFGVDANGKPGSLSFDTADGASVHVAVEPAPAAAWREIVGTDGGWVEHAGATSVRTIGSPDDGEYRLEAVLTPTTEDLLGLVARWRGPGQNYRFVLDRKAAEVRFERRLGGSVLVLVRAPYAAPPAGVPLRLAFQLQGFRLSAAIDDAPVLACFDGALTAGSFGTCQSGPAADWRLRVAPPAPLRGSAALVQDGTHVALHAVTAVEPGHWYVMRLELDRPHPLVPTWNGVEPSLLQRPAAPEVLLADWRGQLGRRGIGEIDPTGLLQWELDLPVLPALRHRTALLRALLVEAHGDAQVGRTPPLPVRF
jgi:hypothetical protein